MKVNLEKTFPMPASADIAWTLLKNIEEVAACMPGASITERIDAQHYKGNVAVKFGPASMSFRGEIEVALVDAAARAIQLIGKGTDSTGSSGASMDLSARVEAIDAASCNLLGNSEVSVSGKAAAFGGRMMGAVADQVLKQFAVNFAAKAQALQAQAATSATPPPAPGGPSVSALPQASSAEPANEPSAAARAPGSSAAGASAAQPARAAPAAQLDGFALLWAIVKDWLRSLFGAKRA